MQTIQKEWLSHKGFQGITQMSAKEWASVLDNPRQRDTVEHAKKAKHLTRLIDAHLITYMGVLPDGTRYKLDGHTRSYVWEHGLSDAVPQIVTVCVFACNSIDEIKEMYRVFDSRSAVETTTDKLFGAQREHGVEFQSKMFRARRYATALGVSHKMLFGQAVAGNADIYERLSYWLPEVLLVDKLDPAPKMFPAGVLAGALLTYRRYGPDADEFWTAYANNQGEKLSGEMDAVQAYSERMFRIKTAGQLNGFKNHQAIVAVTLSAFDSYRSNFMYNTSAGGIKAYRANTLTRWLTAAAKTKRSW